MPCLDESESKWKLACFPPSNEVISLYKIYAQSINIVRVSFDLTVSREIIKSFMNYYSVHINEIDSSQYPERITITPFSVIEYFLRKDLYVILPKINFAILKGIGSTLISEISKNIA